MILTLPAAPITSSEYKLRTKTDLHYYAYACNGTLKATFSILIKLAEFTCAIQSGLSRNNIRLMFRFRALTCINRIIHTKKYLVFSNKFSLFKHNKKETLHVENKYIKHAR